jgi:hypothetical protein
MGHFETKSEAASLPCPVLPTWADVSAPCVRPEQRARVPACFQRHCRLPVGNRFPPKRSANASASSGLAKQNTTKSLSSRRGEHVSGLADKTPHTGSAYHLTRVGLAGERNEGLAALKAERASLVAQKPPDRDGNRADPLRGRARRRRCGQRTREPVAHCVDGAVLRSARHCADGLDIGAMRHLIALVGFAKRTCECHRSSF